MHLHLNRSLYLNRYFSLGKLTALSTLYTLGVLGIGLAILCVPTTASAGRIVVHPGDSIQAAVDAAAPGDKIVVKPGTYMEIHGGTAAVRITKDGIRLLGKPKGNDKVILVPGPGNLDGILVKPANPGDPDIDGYRIQGFTVQGFPNNGIKLKHVNNFKIIRNESIDNLENGIQPELSANGLVKKNLSYGSDDSALWVEGGVNVRVIRNITHSSVTGIEVTISRDLLIKKNESYNNVVGMGLYHPNSASEPPIAGELRNWHVVDNYIHDNNKINTAPPGSLAADLPTGGGILLMGVDLNLVERNRIENNDFYGLAVIDYCLAVGGTSNDCNVNPPVVEPVPNFNRISRNKFLDNGLAPDPSHPLAPFAADITHIILDSNAGNCYEKNTFATYSSITGGGPHKCP